MGRRRRHGPPKQLPAGDYIQVVKENPAFEEFYSQQLGFDPAERSRFISTAQEQLPVTFRLNPTYPGHERIRNILRSPESMSSLIGDVEIAPVSWYPRGLAWQVQTTRSNLKRDPRAKPFHTFLQEATDSGLVTRQELVSMLPVLALEIQPGHHVADLCAAPGSKTSQCIEELQGQGFVLANDADPNRAYMLIHQLHRANTSLMAVVNHQAQLFPHIGPKDSPFLFDRIICDVPCTGDGAIRKLPTKWKTWSERDAYGIHSLQADILTRAISLCKEDGLVAYSTCSLNPIEDEAVVATVLKRFGSEVELVDLVQRFAVTCPGLLVRPGLPTWKVLIRDKSSESKSAFLELTPGQEITGHAIKATCFPEGENQLLSRTVRILPHDQNTGGFFIALFHKLRTHDVVIPPPEPVEEVEYHSRKSEKRPNFLRLTNQSGEFCEMRECYGLKEDFPARQLLAITESKRSKVFFVNRDLANFLDQDVEGRLALFNLGVRAFCKNREKGSKEDCSYRLCQEGLPFMSEFVRNRRISCNDGAVLKELLVKHSISLDEEICRDLANKLGDDLGYFIVEFTCLSFPELLVVLKHPTNRLSSMASDEHTAGLKLVHQIS